MQRSSLLILFLCLLAGCPSKDQPWSRALSGPPARPPSEEELKRLISEAAAMSVRDLGDFAATGVVAPRVENQSLTWMILRMPPPDLAPQGTVSEFRILDLPLADPMLKVMAGGNELEQTGHLSLIRPEYITSVQREVRGQQMTGTVSFRAPHPHLRKAGLYEGAIPFRARASADGWRIEEFHLPDYGLRTFRTAEGRWKMEDQKPHSRLGIRWPTVLVPMTEGPDPHCSPVPCRVAFTFSTLSPVTRPGVGGRTDLRIILRRKASHGRGCIYELQGHPHVISSPRDLHAQLAERAKALGKDHLPPVVVRARPGVRWEHIVGTCSAAEDAGFSMIHLYPLTGRIEVFLVGRAEERARKLSGERVTVRIPSKYVPGKPEFGAEAKSYWLDDRRYSPDKLEGLSRALAARLAEAGKKGHRDVRIEIRADRELAWSQVGAVLVKLPRLPGAPSRRRATTFFGIDGRAHHIVYVIDRSGSMVERFDSVRNEMLISLSRLRRDQDFHVILFAEGTPNEDSLRQLVPAIPKNKEAAATFLDSIRPAGQTDPIPALTRAFAVLATADPKKPGKWIYLLSDGNFPDNAAVLGLVRKLNKDKAVRICTYLLGLRPPEAVKVMKQIAKESGGRYRYVPLED